MLTQKLLILTSVLLLSSCEFFGPKTDLGLKEKVSLKGSISDLDNAPWTGKVTLTPNGDQVNAQTNAQGEYSFDLLGFETQKNGHAIPIAIEAIHDNGSSVKQNHTALNAESTAAPMQFWNSLKQPDPETSITTQTPTFSWATHASATQYEFVLTSKAQVIWKETLSQTELTLKPGFLDNNHSYDWQVKANQRKYQANTEARPFKTKEIREEIPIKDIQVNGKIEPKTFDKSLESSLSFVKPLPEAKTISLVVDLGSSQDIQGLITWGSGFSADVQIFASNDGNNWEEPIKSVKLDKTSHITLPLNQKRYIKLEILPQAFIHITEVKVF